MKFIQVLATFMLVGSSIAIPNPFDGDLGSRQLCKKPFCKALCPDGTPYNCCVVYIRDPCTDHYCKSKEDYNCVCQCKNGAGTYLCNVNYIRDPCEILPTASVKA